MIKVINILFKLLLAPVLRLIRSIIKAQTLLLIDLWNLEFANKIQLLDDARMINIVLLKLGQDPTPRS